MANITPCVALTKYLIKREYTPNIQIRVMAYHSQQLMLLRSEQEKHLDDVLKRKEKKGEDPNAFSNRVIRSHLTQIKRSQPEAKDVLFILVATPVEEVGRDHDFDWAVIEPSSYRSIIQLAGRVKRHREGEVEHPNIGIMQYNIKVISRLENDDKAVFQKPGFEGAVRLSTNNVGQLIDIEETKKRLDAVPRIQQPAHIQAKTIHKAVVADSLVDLEHMMNWRWLANYKVKQPSTLNGWLTQTWFLTALPQVLTPFRGDDSTLKVYRVYDQYKQSLYFCEKDEKGHPINRESVLNIRKDILSETALQRLWLVRDFRESCEKLAEEKDLSPYVASLRYGELRFRFNEKKEYLYNDQLGLVVKQ